MIVEEKKGKVTLLSANKNLPYFSELRGIMVKTTGLGDQMRNALSKLKGIRYALLYGSFASGEETESSDIDLLLVGKVNEEEVLKVVSKVEKEVGREINYILWSDEELSNRANSKHNLLADIIRKQFIMLVRDEDEFRRAVKK